MQEEDDKEQVDNLRQMVVRMMTIRPNRKNSSFKDRTMFNTKVNSSLTMPKRMPSFVEVSALNNHYFSVGNEEYEYVDGCYYMKIDTLKAGDSFG